MGNRFKFEIKKNNLVSIKRKKRVDKRGYFERLYCGKEYNKALKLKYVAQINRAYTKKKGTVRGLHYQLGHNSEEKVVTCIKGKVFDVIVDIRKNSKNFLKWYGKILDSSSNVTNFVPYGFAHGYQTLTDDCEMLYFHSDYYSKQASKIIGCFDPKINIKWPLNAKLISNKDKSIKNLSNKFKGI